MAKHDSRAYQIVLRWTSVLTLGVAGGAIAVVLVAQSHSWLQARPLLEVVLLVLAAVLTVWGMSASARIGAVFGLKHQLTYPSVTLAGLFGTLLVLLLVSQGFLVSLGLRLSKESAQFMQTWIVPGAVLLAAFSLIVSVTASVRSRSPKKPLQDPPLGGSLESFEEILAWIKDDGCIRSRVQDRFGHSRTVDLVAKRACMQSPPAQAILGDLGSGKTSFRMMLDEKLRHESPDVVLVPVETWPYRTAAAAIEGAIRSIVTEFAKEVDVLAVRGLPAEYIRAISVGGGAAAQMAALINTRGSPHETLEKLDAIAGCIGKRFVVWVEDLERFSGDPVNSSSAGDHQALNPIRAFLYSLDQLGSFAVITATTSLRLRIDIEKIARFVEWIPRIPEDELFRILLRVREEALTRHPNDPAKESVRTYFRSALQKAGHAPTRTKKSKELESAIALGRSLSALIHSPRQLKQTLRAAWDAWESLQGEVDFDDLLVISVLRAGAPDVFALVDDHFDSLRELSRRNSEASDSSLTNLEDEIKELCSKKSAQPSAHEALPLVAFVFSERRADKPQALHKARYWKRYREQRVDPKDQDGPMLKIFAQEKSSEVVQLLENLGHPSRDITRGLARYLLDTSRKADLLKEWATRRLEESPSEWSCPQGYKGMAIPGYLPLAYMWADSHQHGSLPSKAILKALLEVLQLVVPFNLELAITLVDDFAVVGHEPGSMLRPIRQHDPPFQRLAGELVGEFLRLFVRSYSNEERLAEGLKDVRPDFLSRVLWLKEGELRRKTPTRFEGWPEIAQALLGAARRSPETVLVRLVEPLTIKHGPRKFAFRGDVAEHLFGQERVFALVRELPQGSWTSDNRVQSVLEAAGVGNLATN